MRHQLIYTTTEVFEYDPAKIKGAFSLQWRMFLSRTIEERERRGHLPLTNEQIFESWIIEQFEQHNGSAFGDGLFAQLDINAGTQLVTKADDE